MPVLGYDTAGSTTLGGSTVIYGSISQADSIGGWIKTFHCACGGVDANDKGLILAVCDAAIAGNHDPSGQARVEQVLIDPASISNDLSAEGAGGIIEADAWYYLTFKSENINTKIKYDSGDLFFWSKAAVGFEIPNPLPEGFSQGGNYSMSIWIDYVHPGILGYDIAGINLSYASNVRIYGTNDITDAFGGVIKKFHIAIGALDAVNKGAKITVSECNQGTGNPSGSNVVEQVEFDVVISDDNEVVAPEGNALSASTKYCLPFMTESGDTKVKYDTIAPWVGWRKLSVTYPAQFTDPLPTGFTILSNYAFSVWIDYEEAEGQEFIRSISDTIEITDTLSRSGIFVREAMNTIGITDALSYVRIKVGKIVDTIGIIDIISTIVARVKETDCFGVCRIVKVKAKEKLISTIRKIDFFQHPEE